MGTRSRDRTAWQAGVVAWLGLLPGCFGHEPARMAAPPEAPPPPRAQGEPTSFAAEPHPAPLPELAQGPTRNEAASPTPPTALGAPALLAAAPPRELLLRLPQPSVELEAGHHPVRVELPAASYVTLGILGAPDALIRWRVSARPDARDPLSSPSLDDDEQLPTFLSFVTDDDPSYAVVDIECRTPVTLWRVTADPNDLEAPSPRTLKLGRAEPRPIIGFPAPLEPRAGYLFKPPSRYLFFRIDVAVALRSALQQTAIRFRRNPIVVGDGSQWNGEAPGMDRDSSRHIGHRGGTEVDIGLPSDDDSPSTIERRCTGVLIEKDELVCSPGTVRHLDAYRLAYFLGLLLDGPTPNGIHMPKGRPGPIAPVLSILTDQAYVDEIRKAAERLRKRRWIHDEGYGALVEEGLLRPSSWHTDHVHIRFAGERGRRLVH